MKYIATALCMFVVPYLAQAEETVASEPTLAAPKVKFLPIDRNNSPHVATAKKPLRSDSNAMTGGFMRLDRNRTVQMKGPLVVQPAAATTSADANAVRIIRGAGPSEPATPTVLTDTGKRSSNPILSLFDDEGTTRPNSFRDALTGSTGSTKLAPHQWPIPADARQKVSSNYGFRSDPFNKETKFHGGVDIAAPIGTPVLATADGRVATVGNEGGYGTTITLLHEDGSESRYSHLSSESVNAGQYVKSGQSIGAVGSSGHSTGPHLDYRLTQDGVTVDPAKTLREGRTADAEPARIVQRKLQAAAKTERLIEVR